MFSSSSVIASLARILADTIDPVATSLQQTPNMAIGSGAASQSLQQAKAESAQEMAEFLKKQTQSCLLSLMEAADNGNTDQTAAALKWLVSNFFDTSEFLNHYDVNGDLAQIISAAEGPADVVKGLTQAVPIQEILNQPRPDGMTVLMVAAERGHSAVVKQLLQVLKTPLAINQARPDGWTALTFAALTGQTGVVQALLQVLKKPEDINHPGPNGSTALMAAALTGQTGVVQALLQVLKKPEAINQARQDGWTALMLAAQQGHTEVVQALLQVLNTPEAINQASPNGLTALMVAAQQGHTEVVQALLQVLNTPEAINHPDADGWTALMLAARFGETGVVQALLQVLKTPEEINRALVDGRTALMLADQRGRRETVVAILDRLAQLGRVPGPGALTAVDRSMMEIAGRRGHFEALIGWLPSGAGSGDQLSKTARKELIDIFLAAYDQHHDYLINMPNFLSKCAMYGHEDLAIMLLYHNNMLIYRNNLLLELKSQLIERNNELTDPQEYQRKIAANENKALELAIAHGQPGVLNAWLSQSRVVTPDQIKSAMAAWRANLPAAHAVAGSPSTNEVHITAMHDWDFLNEFFIEEQISKLRPAEEEATYVDVSSKASFSCAIV